MANPRPGKLTCVFWHLGCILHHHPVATANSVASRVCDVGYHAVTSLVSFVVQSTLANPCLQVMLAANLEGSLHATATKQMLTWRMGASERHLVAQ